MVSAAARMIVSSPVRTPLSFGLLSAVQLVDDADIHWRNGVVTEPGPCDRALITTDSCPATGGPAVVITKTSVSGLGCTTSDPFTVYTRLACSAVGFYDADPEGQATSLLVNGEARAVEREFESGEHGTMPHLASNTVVTGFDGCTAQTAAEFPVTGSPLVLDHAIAELEEALGECYGNEGVIHVPPIVLGRAARYHLFTRDGPRLRSPAGHLVAVGSGYRGLSPAGAEPSHDQPYIYATGAITVRRSAVNVTSGRADALDRATNDLIITAERTYVISVDNCCHFVVQTDLITLI